MPRLTLLLALGLVACGGRTGFVFEDPVFDDSTGEDEVADLPDAVCAGGAGAPTLLASGVAGPASIAAYHDTVYFAGWFSVNASVWSVPRDGGELRVLAEKQNAPTAIVADARGAAWTTFDAVMRASTSGGLTRVASGLDSPGDLALQGSTVYVADRSNTGAANPDATGKIIAFRPSKQVIADGLLLPTSLVLDDHAAYWTDWLRGVVASVSLAGGSPVVLATHSTPSDIELYDGGLYYSSGAQSVFRVPTAGGDAERIFTAADLSIRDIKVDATGVYVAGHDPEDWSSGALLRVSFDGGLVEVLDQGHAVYAIALDRTRVFWARGVVDEVWMRCK